MSCAGPNQSKNAVASCSQSARIQDTNRLASPDLASASAAYR
jgi:hypothetical protein